MDLGLAGRRAAVSASTSGLGLGVARALAHEGVDVAICGREQSRLVAAEDSIEGTVHPIVADVSDADGAVDFVRRAAGAFDGSVDILVTNTGGPAAGGFFDTDVDDYRSTVEQHFLAVVAMCREVVPAMVKRGWGRIVAITSMTVREPLPDVILSSPGRAAATAFLKSLSLELAGTGVTVNTVQPGAHATPRLSQLYSAEQQASLRQGDPENFGRLVAFVCSDHAEFVNGASIAVDGGRSDALP